MIGAVGCAKYSVGLSAISFCICVKAVSPAGVHLRDVCFDAEWSIILNNGDTTFE